MHFIMALDGQALHSNELDYGYEEKSFFHPSHLTNMIDHFYDIVERTYIDYVLVEFLWIES